MVVVAAVELLSRSLTLSRFSLLSFPSIVAALAAQAQGLPAGFTASCEQTCRENCVVGGHDGRGGDYECWKKMPEREISNDAKISSISVSAVLALAGSIALLHVW